MPRPRKPTEILELNGAFRKDPQRRRHASPKSGKCLGEPPEYFSEESAAVWAEVQCIVPANVLTSADRFIVELLCRLVSKFRQDWLTGAEMAQMTWCFSRLGMTPADRSRISLAPEKEESPFDEFLTN